MAATGGGPLQILIQLSWQRVPSTRRIHRRTQLDEAQLDYLLIRVPRRRHIHLLVNEQGQLEVRVPLRCTLREVEWAIRQQGQWVLRGLARAKTKRCEGLLVAPGASLPLGDAAIQLARGGQQARFLRYVAPVLYLPGQVPADGCGELLTRWYRKRARSYLGARLGYWSEQVGRGPARLAIRDQRSRWGSCSSSGTISLNWRLMLLPAELSDYVLVHELCHLLEMNHSAAFWGEVERILPEWRTRRRRLRDYPREKLVFQYPDGPAGDGWLECVEN